MKSIIITGANGNLGVATVKRFLDEGYRVIAVDGKNDHLDFALTNPHFEFEPVNLTEESESAAFVSRSIQKHDRIDSALMLVGGFSAGNIGATSGTELKNQFRLNFETAYYLSRPLLDHMKKNGYGRLIFIGSRPALNPSQGYGLIAYALAKSLLFRLAEFINEENKGSAITATVVVPSTIDTPLNRKNMPSADPSAWVRPEKLADVLAFLVSSQADPLRETVLKVYNNS